MELPEIVSEEEWQQSHEALLAKEKEATRARDALAAERRRQPMTEISADYEFEGPDGVVQLPDLFEGRPQLILYHFWHPPEGEPCSGCSMFTDQVGHARAHQRARRDHRAGLDRAAAADRGVQAADGLGSSPWYTVVGDEFQNDARDDRVLLARRLLARRRPRLPHLRDQGRGVEALGSVWTFLDLTPLGRQEEWEDTPGGRPQTAPYQWWRYHDEYETAEAGR